MSPKVPVPHKCAQCSKQFSQRGNLTTHIKHLQKAGYVGVTKSFRGKRPLTTLSLTTDGRTAFTTYIDTLEQIVQSARSGN